MPFLQDLAGAATRASGLVPQAPQSAPAPAPAPTSSSIFDAVTRGVQGVLSSNPGDRDAAAAPLPDWLKKAGMKGDNKAGDMLKPEARYGMWFKMSGRGGGGTVYLADGTKAKARRDGDTYTWKDPKTGEAKSYVMSAEEQAYRKEYNAKAGSTWDKVAEGAAKAGVAIAFQMAGNKVMDWLGSKGGAFSKVSGVLRGQVPQIPGTQVSGMTPPIAGPDPSAGVPAGTTTDATNGMFGRGGVMPAGAGAGSAGASVPGTQTPAPVPQGEKKGGFLSSVWDFVTSENGMQLLGGALQGYSAQRAQDRQIKEQRRYTRPFTSGEVEGITRGADVQAPGGFLERAKRVGEFLNGNPRVQAPTTTPQDVANMSRGG